MAGSESGRRAFLQTLGAGVILGWGGDLSRAAPATRGTGAAVAASDRVAIGCIGLGGMGTGRLKQFLFEEDVEVVALCDVDSDHLARGVDWVRSQKNRKPEVFSDFRKLLEVKEIDAVVVTTPDHWHALPFVLACQAGKDVFVEKPLCHSVAEGRAMVDAAKRYGRISQLGNQVRNDSPNYRQVVDVIRSGKLGKITRVHCWKSSDTKGFGNPPDCLSPPTLDYDFWLGPAPKRPYNPNRSHGRFRHFWDYSGGLFIDFWCHISDLAYWALDLDPPKSIRALGGRYFLTDNTETPDTLEVVYDHDGLIMNWSLNPGNRPGYEHMGGIGCIFQGTDATLVANYGKYEVYVRGRKEDQLVVAPRRSTAGSEHLREFIDGVKTRQRTSSDVEYAYRLTKGGLLGNIAFRTGETIRWDDNHERISNSPKANAMLARQYRRPWKLPKSV
jgi:predicted dehydrogenase